VQRRFTKRLRFLNNVSYSQRSISLDLESLEVGRLGLRQGLLLTYRIVFGLLNIDSVKMPGEANNVKIDRRKRVSSTLHTETRP